MKIKNKEELNKLHQKLSREFSNIKTLVAVCGGTGCRGSKAREIVAAFKAEIKKHKLESSVVLRETGCHGFCEKGPLVVIRPRNIFYQQVTVGHVTDIVEKTILNQEIIEDLLFEVLPEGKAVKRKKDEKRNLVIKEDDVPFYKGQQRTVFGQNGFINPKCIEDYIAQGGYTALAKALTEMTSDDIISEVEKSGLRGRGGGGFPTGRKWRSCRKAKGESKYIVCNADEGDPGAYMDRSILEGNPHSVIEGMIIAAFAIGSNHGYVYVRAEYPLAVENLAFAIDEAREWGLLGDNIMGTSVSFDIKISKGGGAFVCGESTALMLSIAGKVGEPRTKHIHTIESGLFDMPTNLNNVETWANVPLIINRGSSWYSAIGTETSKGTKLFSLVGKVVNTGLVEVPMGVSLRHIIFDIGGGIPQGKKFKAVQTGGPSGGCIPESMLDLPVGFDELKKVGSMMGSGGMIVMDEDTCMVDVSRYFLSFLVEESCGKCTPCREGTYQLYKIVNRITQGKGEDGDIELLEELSETIMDASLCALGKSAPNPVLSAIKYFREEFIQHIKEGKCQAGVCKALFEYEVNTACTMCGLCFKKCPSDAITWKKKDVAVIDKNKCTKCGICFSVCKFDSVAKVKAHE